MRTIILLFTGMLLLGSCNPKHTQQSSVIIENIDAKKFNELIEEEKGIVLDVRTPEEVSEGHIKNASTINFLGSDFIEKINMMQKEVPIYVYCRSGNRSSKAAELLKENGFSKVYNLKGGIFEWENKGYPLVKPDTTQDEKIQQLTLAEFKELLKTDQPVLVDFHTTWCSPCRQMAPIVDRIEELHKDKAVVLRVDIDKSKELGKSYKINGVPVFIIFKNGKEIWKHNGIIAEAELKKQIDDNL
ncbi:MAG: thioredoxin domain-containing protein [Flavobacteriaceae bacterium]|nr:thioredoxin domain-containing protein [Flavobacteriaceae bacterium]